MRFGDVRRVRAGRAAILAAGTFTAGTFTVGTFAVGMLAAGLVLAGPDEAAEGRAKAGDRCPGTAFADALGEVDGFGEIRLASGRRVSLADLRLPSRRPSAPASADPEEEADRPRPAGPALSEEPDPEAVATLRALAGRPVTVVPSGSEDRWGRLRVRIDLQAGSGALDLAELLVRSGLALVDSGERDALCRPDLLRVEGEARGRRLGTWGVTEVLPAAEPEALRAAEGRFVLVEGRVVSVGERRDRTYLNFGRDFARDFAAVVPRRVWAEVKRAGRDAASLKGRIVRIRGTVAVGRAPAVEIAAPDMIEIVEDGPRRP